MLSLCVEYVLRAEREGGEVCGPIVGTSTLKC